MANTPTIEFSANNIKASDFNICFRDSYDGLVLDNYFSVFGKKNKELNKNKIKSNIYQTFLENNFNIMGKIDNKLVGMVAGNKNGDTYEAGFILYAKINNSKDHLDDPDIIIPYEKGLRDFLASNGINKVKSRVLRPCSSYTYHYETKPSRHLINILSDTVESTREDGVEYADIVFEFIDDI